MKGPQTSGRGTNLLLANSQKESVMKYGELTLGQIEALVNKHGGIEGVQRFLRGESKVVSTKHIIDLDAKPFVPDGWKVEEHCPGGQFT